MLESPYTVSAKLPETQTPGEAKESNKARVRFMGANKSNKARVRFMGANKSDAPVV